MTRVSERLQRSITVDFRHGEEWSGGEAVNLSLGGLCLKGKEAFPIGDVVIMKLHLPEGNPIEVTGAVCWTNPDKQEMGIQFDTVAPEDMLTWARWLRTQD